MISISIKDSYGRLLFDDLQEEDKFFAENCSKEIEDVYCKVAKVKKRNGRIKNEKGEVFIITKNTTLLKNKKLFKQLLVSHFSMIDKYKEITETGYKYYQPIFEKIKHNVTTINGQNIQEIYSLVPQEELTRDFKNQLNVINSYILKHQSNKKVAKTLYRLMKNNLLMKAEFQAFDALINPNRQVSKRELEIKKVILNVAHTFFFDFTERNIYVSVEENDDKVSIHYPTVAAALVHVFDNAKKYTKADTELNIKFEKSNDWVIVVFDMISYKVFDNEVTNLYDEGFSGKYANTYNLSGAGMGMSLIKILMNLNKGKYEFNNNINPNKKVETLGAEFENNEVRLYFPIAKKTRKTRRKHNRKK